MESKSKKQKALVSSLTILRMSIESLVQYLNNMNFSKKKKKNLENN